jgi:hypothetical protein
MGPETVWKPILLCCGIFTTWGLHVVIAASLELVL